MAGSYSHMVKEDGTPKKDFGVGTSLDSPGDVIETLEECYGIIWSMAITLAGEILGRQPTRGDLQGFIWDAKVGYEIGLRRGKSGT